MLRQLLFAVGCVVLALTLLLAARSTIAYGDDAAYRPDQVALTPHDGPAGGELQSIGDGYLSPITQAARPFTHALLRWEAFEPVTDTLTLELRFSADGASWSEWLPVYEDPDLWVPEDGDRVYWSQVIYAGGEQRFWQVRANLEALADGTRPTLDRIEVNTVDARFGPDSAPAATTSSVGRPSTVSRQAWGGPEIDHHSVDPKYRKVTHMVVHHTADANRLNGRESNWGDRVRAIWSFHTYTRDWGDVGYNFLVDPNGVVYEGRKGGDDAVGFHDTGNFGSMGVVLIGTFASVEPTGAAQESLVQLLAWKAEHRGIDPLGRSFYYGCSISKYCKPFSSGSIIENISGHRQVTPGHTTCPGDILLNLLPQIRSRVAERLNGAVDVVVPDNGDLLIDNLEASMVRSNANWYSRACGLNGHTNYTYATDRPEESTNTATWRPGHLPDGRYRVYAHIPQGCGIAPPPYATGQAHYQISHAAGTSEVRVDQNTAQQWVDLGEYDFSGGQGSVSLSDLSGEPYSARKVIFFDAVKWERVERASIELLHVQYDRSEVPVGELLRVTFTVRNNGDVPVQSQNPEATQHDDGTFDSVNGYAYDESECVFAPEGSAYPSFAKETGRFRLLLGSDREVACGGESGGYIWRWGLNGALQPGEVRDVVGYVRFRTPGPVNLRAGAVQEYVNYNAENAFATTINVVPERLAPVPMVYSAELQPLAVVYRMGAIPDSLLARTDDAQSVIKGERVGSFAWNGEAINWGLSGPLTDAGVPIEDQFIVEQTRVFLAPLSGFYTFRLTADDGAWLWVNGQLVVSDFAFRDASESPTGSIYLEAGRHVLSFKSFDRSGEAQVGYAMQGPEACLFGPPTDGLGGSSPQTRDIPFNGVFRQLSGLTIAADDLGGSGVVMMRFSINGAYGEGYGNLLTLGQLPPGEYLLQYSAVDAMGNESPSQEMRFVVAPAELTEMTRLYLPMVRNTSSRGGC
jgi:hypothetical protein